MSIFSFLLRSFNQDFTECQPSSNDSLGRLILKRKVPHYAQQLSFKNKRIKYLNQQVLHQCKSIFAFKSVIKTLKDKNLLHHDNADVISVSFYRNSYLINN